MLQGRTRKPGIIAGQTYMHRTYVGQEGVALAEMETSKHLRAETTQDNNSPLKSPALPT